MQLPPLICVADAMETDEAAEDDGADFLLTDSGDDVDLRLARLEALAGRRAALLSAVMLRQNPHNVAEWHKRVKLFTGDPTKQVRGFFTWFCVWFHQAVDVLLEQHAAYPDRLQSTLWLIRLAYGHAGRLPIFGKLQCTAKLYSQPKECTEVKTMAPSHLDS
jgi:hypothetical protein